MSWNSFFIVMVDSQARSTRYKLYVKQIKNYQLIWLKSSFPPLCPLLPFFFFLLVWSALGSPFLQGIIFCSWGNLSEGVNLGALKNQCDASLLEMLHSNLIDSLTPPILQRSCSSPRTHHLSFSWSLEILMGKKGVTTRNTSLLSKLSHSPALGQLRNK